MDEKKIDHGGPAFPTPEPQIYVDRLGMSLRDWFAGQVAVDGIEFASAALAAKWVGVDAPDEDDFVQMLEFTFKLEAFIRLKKADAMIAARKAGA